MRIEQQFRKLCLHHNFWPREHNNNGPFKVTGYIVLQTTYVKAIENVWVHYFCHTAMVLVYFSRANASLYVGNSLA